MEGTNPVNKKLAAALSGGAVLVLALSGCSGDDGDEKVNAWAKKVCDQVQPQIKKTGQRQQTIISTADDSKPADIQKADSQAFQDIADAYKALATAVSRPVRRPSTTARRSSRTRSRNSTHRHGLRST